MDANSGRLVTYGPDVLDVKQEIESRWDSLSVFFDTIDEIWVIVEHCKDGVDRLVFDTPVLSMETVERIQRAQSNTELDVDKLLRQIDSHNEKLERDQERKFEDKIGDAAERLMHALRKDGVIHYPTAFISNRG